LFGPVGKKQEEKKDSRWAIFPSKKKRKGKLGSGMGKRGKSRNPHTFIREKRESRSQPAMQEKRQPLANTTPRKRNRPICGR